MAGSAPANDTIAVCTEDRYSSIYVPDTPASVPDWRSSHQDIHAQHSFEIADFLVSLELNPATSSAGNEMETEG